MTIQRLLSPFLLFVLLVQLIALTASLNAYYPLGLYHIDGGTAYPIIGVQRGQPLAIKDGKERKVSSDSISISRLDMYHSGSISITDQEPYVWNSNVRSVHSTNGQGNGEAPNRGIIEMTLNLSALHTTGK